MTARGSKDFLAACAECGRRSSYYTRPDYAWRAETRSAATGLAQLGLNVHKAGTPCCDRHRAVRVAS